MPRKKYGIDEDRIKEDLENMLPFISILEETDDRYSDGVPLRVIRGNFRGLGPRTIRQIILRGIRDGRLNRTRVETDVEGREAAVTTQEPPEDIVDELESIGEECGIEGFSREYSYTTDIGFEEGPETKYNYEVFSHFSDLFGSHMERHDILEKWQTDKLSREEDVVAAWRLKGIDPESEESERETGYELKVKDGYIELSGTLTLRKTNDCIWGVDPLDADKYLREAMGTSRDKRFFKLFERAFEAERLAEHAADLIRDDDRDYHEEDWKKNFDRYRDFLISGKRPDDYFDKPKDKRGVALSTDPFLKELDGYVDTMKKGRKPGREVSETKLGLLKDTKTATERYKEPIEDFLEYVEEAVYGRLKSGFRE